MRRTMLAATAMLGLALTAAAQEVPVATSVVAADIGLECPEAQALSPDGATLWVLMQGCFSGGYALQAFSAADGAPVPLEADFADRLAPLIDGDIVSYTNPMAFVDEDTISIRYSLDETYELRSITVTTDGQPAEPVIDDESLMALLGRYSEYPEQSMFSDDHQLAVAIGEASAHVLDLASGAEILALDYPPDSYNVFPSFSPDGSLVYIAQLDEPDNFDNYNAVVTAYSTADGSALESWPVPSPFLWVSPDGRYAAAELGANDGSSSDIFVVNLETGGTSAAIPMYEPPRGAAACANDGRSLTDLDISVDGRLRLTRVSWLADSSGFIYTRSYGGDGLGGGRPCALDTSRLDIVAISG
jgi:hypothetical protein